MHYLVRLKVEESQSQWEINSEEQYTNTGRLQKVNYRDFVLPEEVKLLRNCLKLADRKLGNSDYGAHDSNLTCKILNITLTPPNQKPKTIERGVLNQLIEGLDCSIE